MSTIVSKTFGWLMLSLLAWFVLPAAVSWAQYREDATMRSASAVLNEINAIPLKGIPQSLLAGSQGIAILPNMIKGSFVVGARHGRGVLLVRDDSGNWQSPTFITLTGGNVGWQIGLQATDLILVFKTRQSIQGILGGKLTIGADAAAAAGPIGRQAAAATDERLKAEIYSYSRSRGLFAGVSIDGSVLQIDHTANAIYYRSPGQGQPAAVPEAAAALIAQVASYCGGAPTYAPQGMVDARAIPFGPTPAGDADALRRQLVQDAASLQRLLDARWQAYLALPAEVTTGAGRASAEMLSGLLARFDGVAQDPRYQALAQRPEFRSTHQVLKRYVGTQLQTATTLQLPPPPDQSGAAGGRPARY